MTDATMRLAGRIRIAAAVLGALLLAAGCVSTTGERTDSTQTGVGRVYPQPSVPMQPPQAGPLQTQPAPIPAPQNNVAIAPPPQVLPAFPRSAEDISGQAVVSLMKQAGKARAAGQYDQASDALERAVRIEPRNYFVWSALARNYLDKKLYDNAESIALKSNSLARGNVYVELENWKTIGAARQGQGDAIGAMQALSKADEIQRNLTGG